MTNETTPDPRAAPTLLDPDKSDTLRLTVQEAHRLGTDSLAKLGYSTEDCRIIVDHLIDNSLCGYRFAGLPRILAIADSEFTKIDAVVRPISIIKESPISALMDGGSNVGYLAAFRAAEVAIEKAKKSGIAVIGLYDSYYSGRNAYYAEHIAKAGLICIHTASAPPRVLPPGAARPALGTNPLSIAFPTLGEPVVYDIGTASMMSGEVQMHQLLGLPIPEGIGFDRDGKPTTNADRVMEGGVAPFAGHKGYGLSLVVQALGLLAGATKARGKTQDFAFLFIAIDPSILLDEGDFQASMSQLIADIKATPRQEGVQEIRIPSERAFRERKIRKTQGIVLDRQVVDALHKIKDRRATPSL